jgi:hypothetical protein
MSNSSYPTRPFERVVNVAHIVTGNGDRGVVLSLD